jgi:hypothetical protein
MYIGLINYNYKDNNSFYKLIGYIKDYNTITKYFNSCPDFLKKENITYKYMIRERFIDKRFRGKKFSNLIQGVDPNLTNQIHSWDFNRKLNDFNYYIGDFNIKIILQSLKIGIDNFITNLYENNYILDSINQNNIILKEEYIFVDNLKYLDSQVCFIDYTKFRKCDSHNKNNDIKALGEFISWLFTTFNFSLEIVNKETLDLVNQLYKDIQSNTINSPSVLSKRLGVIINKIENKPQWCRCQYLTKYEQDYKL